MHFSTSSSPLGKTLHSSSTSEISYSSAKMKSLLASIFLAATAQAFYSNQSSCCFEITALIPSTHTNASLGQLSDGQVRIGGGLLPSVFCLSSTSIADQSSRGCIITTPETQFQCDSGATGASGFSIGCDGLISYDGNSTFWECQTDDDNEANIYITPGGTQCGPIQLVASGCLPSCASPPPPATPPPATPTPSPSPTSAPTPASCTPDFSNPTAFQYPHLIIPVDSSHPTTSNGTSYFGIITPTTSSLYNFDIPSSYAGKTCSLIFLFPAQSSLSTSSYSFSGNGNLSFGKLAQPASAETTYDNRPAISVEFPDVQVIPGGEEGGYVVWSGECPAGETVGYEIGDESGGDTELIYFQDYNPSPIGIYVFPC